MPRVYIKDLDATTKGPGSDMGLYFNGTFLKVSKDGKEEAVWAMYGNSGGFHSFTLEDKKKMTIPHLDPNAYIEWEFPTGWFNTKKSSVFCSRLPKRQNHKGINHGVNYRMLEAAQLAKKMGILVGEQKDVLSAVVTEGIISESFTETISIFKTPYPSLPEAYVSLRTKKAFSRALSNEIILMPHPQSKDFLVFVDTTPVGELVTKNKVKLVLEEFRPECAPFFQSIGVTVV
jgi:hypothetical protein